MQRPGLVFKMWKIVIWWLRILWLLCRFVKKKRNKKETVAFSAACLWRRPPLQTSVYMTLSKMMTLLSSELGERGQPRLLKSASEVMYSRWWGPHTGLVRSAQRCREGEETLRFSSPHHAHMKLNCKSLTWLLRKHPLNPMWEPLVWTVDKLTSPFFLY